MDERPTSESQRLAALRAMRILDTPADPRFDAITRLVADVLRAPIALITLIDERRQWFKSRIGLDLPETARAIAFCDITIQQDDVLVVPDTTADRRFRSNPLVTGAPGLRFYAGVPLRTREGHAIGTLSVADLVPRTMGPWEEQMLRRVAALVVQELERWTQIADAEQAQREEAAAMDDERARERIGRERRFQALIEHAPDLVLLLDTAGRVAYAGPSITHLLGHTPSALVGHDLAEACARPEDAEAQRRHLQALLEAPGRPLPAELRLRHADGSWRLFSMVGQNLLADADVQAVVLNGRDVTAERDARAALERAQDHLRQAQKMEALGRVAGGIAHDFNNLLTVIGNNAMLAMRALPAGAPAREEIEQILAASERAGALTRRILAFARRQPLTRTPTDMGALVRGVLDLLARLLGEHVEVAFVSAADVPPVVVDAAQVEQVIINLCANARDAMTEGGRIDIRLAPVAFPADVAREWPWARPGRFVMLAVRDHGPGMPPEVLEHAFEPFFTTKPAGAGTGLGLSTVYAVVAQHDGLLDVQTAPGQGTEVRAFFPAAGPDVSVHEPRPTPDAARGRETILLAEDDELVRRVAARILEDAGYTVMAVRDGAEAVTTFEAHADDVALVLLDVVMPRLGGVAALERIRARRRDVRHILLTGYTVDTDVGVVDGTWMPKPYTATDLLRRVRQALDG